MDRVRVSRVVLGRDGAFLRKFASGASGLVVAVEEDRDELIRVHFELDGDFESESPLVQGMAADLKRVLERPQGHGADTMGDVFVMCSAVASLPDLRAPRSDGFTDAFSVPSSLRESVHAHLEAWNAYMYHRAASLGPSLSPVSNRTAAGVFFAACSDDRARLIEPFLSASYTAVKRSAAEAALEARHGACRRKIGALVAILVRVPGTSTADVFVAPADAIDRFSAHGSSVQGGVESATAFVGFHAVLYAREVEDVERTRRELLSAGAEYRFRGIMVDSDAGTCVAVEEVDLAALIRSYDPGDMATRVVRAWGTRANGRMAPFDRDILDPVHLAGVCIGGDGAVYATGAPMALQRAVFPDCDRPLPVFVARGADLRPSMATMCATLGANLGLGAPLSYARMHDDLGDLGGWTAAWLFAAFGFEEASEEDMAIANVVRRGLAARVSLATARPCASASVEWPHEAEEASAFSILPSGMVFSVDKRVKMCASTLTDTGGGMGAVRVAPFASLPLENLEVHLVSMGDEGDRWAIRSVTDERSVQVLMEEKDEALSGYVGALTHCEGLRRARVRDSTVFVDESGEVHYAVYWVSNDRLWGFSSRSSCVVPDEGSGETADLMGARGVHKLLAFTVGRGVVELCLIVRSHFGLQARVFRVSPGSASGTRAPLFVEAVDLDGLSSRHVGRDYGRFSVVRSSTAVATAAITYFCPVEERLWYWGCGRGVVGGVTEVHGASVVGMDMRPEFAFVYTDGMGDLVAETPHGGKTRLEANGDRELTAASIEYDDRDGFVATVASLSDGRVVTERFRLGSYVGGADVFPCSVPRSAAHRRAIIAAASRTNPFVVAWLCAEPREGERGYSGVCIGSGEEFISAVASQGKVSVKVLTLCRSVPVDSALDVSLSAIRKSRLVAGVYGPKRYASGDIREDRVALKPAGYIHAVAPLPRWFEDLIEQGRHDIWHVL